MTTRCLFRLDSLTEYASVYVYRLTPVTNGTENKAFWEYTPSGNLELTIQKKLGKLFDFNKEYYLDFTEKV